jgi:hypothetical protein
MRLPQSVVVRREKLLQYLLVPRPTDDKSNFLLLGGFSRSNPDRLEEAILKLARIAESYEDGKNEYGVFWRTEGNLVGPIAQLPVVLIWLQWFADGSFHFVTLKPKRRE